MIREPWFWRETSPAARLAALALSPASALYDAAQRLRAAAAQAVRAPAPVVCIGAPTVGGVGKTPFAIALAEALADRAGPVAFLTRGYGGRAKGPLIVDPSVHDATLVGDEPLLLARVAPTVVAADRPAGASLAAKNGAAIIIMDDGYQNPTIDKDVALLLEDADDPYGNGRVFPAGPLREPPARARARADAVVRIGAAPQGDADFTARLVLRPLTPGPVIAFCGIGRPDRFFHALDASGAEIVRAVAFADHHPYTDAEIEGLKRLAGQMRARLVTTEKDLVRLRPGLADGVEAAPARMMIDHADRLVARILERIAARRPAGTLQ